MDDRPRQFVAEFAACEHQLYRYILSLLPDPTQAQDVFQDTAVTLWEKFDTYDPQQPFINWVIGIARHKVLAHRKKFARQRHTFSDQTLELIADQAVAERVALDEQVAALHECMAQLKSHEYQLIQARYDEGPSLKEYAQRTGRPVNTLYKSLDRIRRKLLACMQLAMPQS